jgi:hypothetical protein
MTGGEGEERVRVRRGEKVGLALPDETRLSRQCTCNRLYLSYRTYRTLDRIYYSLASPPHSHHRRRSVIHGLPTYYLCILRFIDVQHCYCTTIPNNRPSRSL